jgi:hypothetical protein
VQKATSALAKNVFLLKLMPLLVLQVNQKVIIPGTRAKMQLALTCKSAVSKRSQFALPSHYFFMKTLITLCAKWQYMQHGVLPIKNFTSIFLNLLSQITRRQSHQSAAPSSHF